MNKAMCYLYLYIPMLNYNENFTELLWIGLSFKHIFYHTCWFTLVFTEMLFPTANTLISVEKN